MEELVNLSSKIYNYGKCWLSIPISPESVRTGLIGEQGPFQWKLTEEGIVKFRKGESRVGNDGTDKSLIRPLKRFSLHKQSTLLAVCLLPGLLLGGQLW